MRQINSLLCRSFGYYCSALLLILSVDYAVAKSLVCLNPSIQGYENTIKSAKALLGSYNTTNKDEIRLFIKKDGDKLFFQSNFCKTSCGEVSPTKILTDERIDLKSALENVIFTSENRLSPEEWAIESKRILKNAKIFLDKSALDSSGRLLLDMSGAENIDIVSLYDKATLASSAFALDLSSPPPLIVRRLSGCCLEGFPALSAAKILNSLRATPIAKQKITLASLVHDTATNSVIGRSDGLKKIAFRPSGIVNDKTSLLKAIKASKGGTLILVGHVEGNIFVTRDGAGRVVFETDLAELHNMAHANNVSLINLGCHTADQIAHDSANVGVSVKFNTVEVMERLNDALDKANTFDELLTHLSSEGLRLVVTEQFAQGIAERAYQADVYAKRNTGFLLSDGKDFWVKIAQIFFSKP